VYRVAGVYAVVAFAVWQVADIAFPGLGLSDAAVTLVLVLTILGFPLALVLAWAYEVRPEAPPDHDDGAREDALAAGDATVVATTDVRQTEAGTAPPEDGPSSIAVLPFENLGTGADNEFFADGVTEEITHTLARSGALRVVARTSAFAFKGRASDIREVAGLLHVTHVLEGSVRRSGDRLRITVQLIDARRGFHIWSERYDRAVGDVFDIQDEIAARVARQLSSELSGASPTRASSERSDRPVHSTGNVAAYDAYLRGRHLGGSFDPHAIREAIEEYRVALAADPDFAPAHAALAAAYSGQAIGLGVASHDTMPRARAAADRALELAPDLPDAHVARALVSLFYERRYAEAKRGFDRALSLNPSYADAYMWSEFYWTYIARVYESAIAANTRALELSPLDLTWRVRRGAVYFLFGRLEEAEAFLRQLVADHPEYGLGWMALGDTLIRMERFEEAASMVDRALEVIGPDMAPGAPMGIAGAGRALAGDERGARELLAELERRAGMGFMTSFWQATILAALGDRDACFRRLEQAYEENDCNLLYIMAAPAQYGIRDDPRFARLVERVGLEPPARA